MADRSARSASLLTAGVGLAAAAGLAYLALAVVEQRRALAAVAERQESERTALARELDELRVRLGDLRREVETARDDATGDSRRLGALIHDLDLRLEALRERTEPMIAEVWEPPVGAQ